MGLTSIVGFLTFFLTTFILSVMMYVKMGMQPKPYFKKADEVWTEGVMQALMVRATPEQGSGRGNDNGDGASGGESGRSGGVTRDARHRAGVLGEGVRALTRMV